jgi:DNA-directed RNA polymerase subunit RPC12/RpoP
MARLKTNEYKCTACGGVFEKGWSDDEAVAELNETFGSVPMEDCGIVCDDCYRKMGFGG